MYGCCSGESADGFLQLLQMQEDCRVPEINFTRNHQTNIFDIWHAVRTFSQKKFPRGSQTKSFSKQTKLEHENHEFWLQIAQSCKQRPSFFSQPTPPVVSSSFNAVIPTVQLQGKSTLLNSITLFLLRHVSTTEDDTSERFVEPAQCLCGLQCQLFSPCQAMVEAA